MGHGEPAPMGLDVAHPPINGCHDLIALNTFKFFASNPTLGRHMSPACIGDVFEE